MFINIQHAITQYLQFTCNRYRLYRYIEKKREEKQNNFKNKKIIQNSNKKDENIAIIDKKIFSIKIKNKKMGFHLTDALNAY